jgi:hypothetical protein
VVVVVVDVVVTVVGELVVVDDVVLLVEDEVPMVDEELVDVDVVVVVVVALPHPGTFGFAQLLQEGVTRRAPKPAAATTSRENRTRDIRTLRHRPARPVRATTCRSAYCSGEPPGLSNQPCEARQRRVEGP